MMKFLLSLFKRPVHPTRPIENKMLALQKYATSPSALFFDTSHASSSVSVCGGDYTNCSEYNEDLDGEFMMADDMDAERYGQTLAAQYEMLEIIGSGSFGVVYKAVDKVTDELVAIKKIPITPKSVHTRQTEVQMLQMLCGCECSCHMHRFFEFEDDLWIVMDFIDGRTLAQMLDDGIRFNVRQIAGIVLHVLSALEYMHARGVVHCDVKTDNMMLDKRGRIVMIDYGCAIPEAAHPRDLIGTLDYIAPEVFMINNPHFVGGPGFYDRFIDVWSLGICVYELAVGHVPYAYLKSDVMVQDAITFAAPPELPGEFPDELCHFVACCLQRDPDRRLTVQQLLQHPFVQNALHHDTSAVLRELWQQSLLPQAASTSTAATRSVSQRRGEENDDDEDDYVEE